jgi:hypothetical protein
MHLTADAASPPLELDEDAPEEEAPLLLPPSSPEDAGEDELLQPAAIAKPTLRQATKKTLELCMETFLLRWGRRAGKPSAYPNRGATAP